MVGGVILIVASFLPYEYEEWISGSLFEFVKDVFSHINDYDYLGDLSAQISSGYGTSGLIIGLMILSFFLLIIGGALGLLHFRGGSIAGPAAMVILTLVPLYMGGTSGISGIGLGFYVGWLGAIICALTHFMGDGATEGESAKRKRRARWDYGRSERRARNDAD